jgi:hypothetical protein
VPQTLLAPARIRSRPNVHQFLRDALRLLETLAEALDEARRLQAEAERRYRNLNFDC